MDVAGLCKGSTADSDSVCEGSNPSPAATPGERGYAPLPGKFFADTREWWNWQTR